jgi:hypothetical protein
MSAVNNNNETNGNRYNSVLPISSKIFYCQLKYIVVARAVVFRLIILCFVIGYFHQETNTPD